MAMGCKWGVHAAVETPKLIYPAVANTTMSVQGRGG